MFAAASFPSGTAMTVAGVTWNSPAAFSIETGVGTIATLGGVPEGATRRVHPASVTTNANKDQPAR